MAVPQTTTTTSTHDFAKRNTNGEVLGFLNTGGTWPVAENEATHGPPTEISSRGPPLKPSRSMPALGRSPTERSMSSVLGYEKVPSNLETAPNGVEPSNISSVVSIMQTTSHYSVSILGNMIQNFPGFGSSMPGGVQMLDKFEDPFVPEIQVKSKLRRKTGIRKWKQMHAVLDTGCHAGDLVTLEIVEALGIQKISKPTEQDNCTFQTISGETLTVCGTVSLTWRGVPRGKILNLTRDFKSRFIVIQVEDYNRLPFQIVIGKETLWSRGILQSPTLMAKPSRDRNTVVMPPQDKSSKDQPKANEAKEPFWIRQRAAAEKEAAARAKENENASPKTNARPPLQPTTPSANGQVKGTVRQLSMESQHNGTASKGRTPTSDSNKTTGSSGKKSIRTSARN